MRKVVLSNHWILLAVGLAFTGLVAAQCPPDVPPAQPVYTLGGRTITVSNVSIDGGGAVAAIAPGAAFNVSFDWEIGPNLTACPGCVTYFHYGLSNVNVPGSPSATTYPNTHCMGSVTPNQVSSSSGAFTAPTEDGFYYITLVSKWVYWCHQYAVNHCNTRIIALIQVGSPQGLIVNVDSTADVSGCGIDDGYIGIDVSGYVGCFTADWIGPGGYTASGTSVSGLAPGDYSVLVSDIGGCDTTLLFTINDVLSEQVDLGCDTALCSGESLLLDVTLPGAVYQWQDGSTDPTFLADQPGVYFVEVTTDSCAASDTIVINYTDLQPDLGPDVRQCGGSVTLNPGVPGAAYAWQDGSNTAQYTIAQSGTYWVDVTLGQCMERDSVEILIDQPFQVDLGPDTSLCGGAVLLSSGVPGSIYEWQDGSTGPDLSATAGGTYWVLVENGLCTDGDTVEVDIDIPVTVDLGPDTSLCSGTIALDATTPGAAYQWQDGSTAPVFTVQVSGTYTVVVDPGTSCPPVSESIQVTYLPNPVPPVISDTTICSPEVFTASVPTTDQVIWWNGQTGNALSVSETGTYWVTVSNQCGSASDTFRVEVEICDCRIDIPTAFSPDNNGFNDIFLPFISCETDFYRMRIFNRWGQLVFDTPDPLAGWNGYWKNRLQEMDSYSWIIEYLPVIPEESPEVRMATGSVLLFR